MNLTAVQKWQYGAQSGQRDQQIAETYKNAEIVGMNKYKSFGACAKYMYFHANFRRFYAFLVQFFLGKSALMEVIWFENEVRMHLQKSQSRKW